MYSIGDYAFKYNKKLEKVTFNESLHEIGRYAFSHCTNLKDIEIPKSVNDIGWNAFQYCTNLTYVNMSSLQSIEAGTFYGCTNLETITIKATRIGIGAFGWCYNLKTILCTPQEPPLAVDGYGYFYTEDTDIVFPHTDKNKCVLYIPKGSGSAYKKAAIWKNFTNIVENAIPVTMSCGDTLQLNSASVVGENVLWSASYNNVSSNGVVIATKVGTDTIKATNRDGYVTNFVVKVKKGKPKITWEQTFDTLHVYEEVVLNATATLGQTVVSLL